MKIERAIEILDPEHREHSKNLEEVNEACQMGMEALERTRWIPCSERLPNDGEFVLAYKNGQFEVQEYEKRRNGWISGGWFWSLCTVTHWMPLPKPPKEDKNGRT